MNTTVQRTHCPKTLRKNRKLIFLLLISLFAPFGAWAGESTPTQAQTATFVQK